MWLVRSRPAGVSTRLRTPWGSIEPHRDLPAPTVEQTKQPGLCGEAKYLGVPTLPTVART